MRTRWSDGLLALDADLKSRLPVEAPAADETAVPLIAVEPLNNATQRYTAESIYAARKHVVEWLSLVLPPEDWTKLQTIYTEPPLRPAVLDAWVRMQGPGMRSFFDTRLLSQDEAELLDLVPAYAAAFPGDYQAALTGLAKSTTLGSVFWACMDYLSQKGVLPSMVSAGRPDFSRAESHRYGRYTLRAAHAHAASGDCAHAQQVYIEIAERNISTQSVRAALEGLAACEYEELYRVSLGYINDPALRPVVIHLLSAHLSDKAEKQLRDKWKEMPPLTQAALLQIFHQRNAESAKPLLTTAKTSPHTAVRYTAVTLLGETPNEDDLWELANSSATWLQDEALRAYLNLAEARVARGEMAEARKQYLTLLQGGMPLDIERVAVEGLGKTGEPGDKGILEQLSAEQTLRAPSERAMVALAGRSGSREEQAEAIGKMSEREVPQAELDTILGSVEDAATRSKLLGTAGFLSEGKAAGPFPLGDATGLQQLHFPIMPYPITTPAQFGGVSHDWTALGDCPDGTRYDLSKCIPTEDAAAAVCAYVTFEIRLPVVAGAFLQVYQDAGFALWVNGQFTAAAEAGTPGWQRQAVVLEAGLSYVVIKLPRGEHGWHAGLRLTKRDGKPYDMNTQAMPEDPLKPVGVQSGDVKKLLDRIP